MNPSHDVPPAILPGDAEARLSTDIPDPPLPLIGQYSETYLPVIDGVVMTVLNYARWLNEDHCQCYVATTKAGFDLQDTEPYQIIRYRSIPLLPRPPYRFGVPMLDQRFLSAQRQLCPGLVHAHSPFFAGMEAKRVARQRQIPLVASFHTKYYDDILQLGFSSQLAQTIVARIVSFYHHADAVWTVNQATADTLRDYGFRNEIEIMPNGTDMDDVINHESAHKQVDKRLGLNPGEKMMLYVGQHTLQKNLIMLLEAAHLYAKTHEPFRLVMVGDGYARASLINRAADLGLAECTIFTGVESDRSALSALYQRADLFVFPSLYDTSGLVIKEAAMARCPSILVEGSNVADGTVDGYNAYLCQNDAQSLCSGMHRALSDDDTRMAIGQMARETLAKPWREIVSGVALRYKEIIREYQKCKKE